MTVLINAIEKELYIQYGSAAAEAMFDYPCYFHQISDCVGIIPYRIESHCAVIFGDPICPESEIPKLTETFVTYCRERNLTIIFITVSEKFAQFAKKYCNIVIEVCEEYVFDPFQDPCAISHRLKHRVEKAKKHGLTMHEYIPFDAEIENSLQQVATQWLQRRSKRQVYLGHLNFFESYIGKRWFYVKEGERITAMIMLSKLEAYKGWLLKFLVTSSDAMHETSEFLMVSLLETLRKENCRFLSKGMMPLKVLGKIESVTSFKTWMLRRAYQLISRIFRFEKRKEYWLRYHPKKMPAYLLLSPNLGLHEIQAMLKVINTHL